MTIGKGETGVIINIAGKKSRVDFFNAATAAAFVKEASNKFGKKFRVIGLQKTSVVSRPDQCPICGSLDVWYNFKDGREFDLRERNKFDQVNCSECGNSWPFSFVQMAPQQDIDNNNPTTSGISDIGGGAPDLKTSADIREYVIEVGSGRYVTKTEHGLDITDSFDKAYHYDSFDNGREAAADAVKIKNALSEAWKNQFISVRIVPVSSIGKEGSMKSASGMNFSPSNVPSQVVQEFYPELQHELISYPNVTNAPMINPEISGDAHTLGVAPAEGIGEMTLQLGDEELLPGAIEDAFEGLTRIGYVSTSPAGGAMGRDGKPQVLEGAPLRKENDIRGPMFTDEFYANYQEVPGASLVMAAKSEEHLVTMKHLNEKNQHSDVPSSKAKGGFHCDKCNAYFVKSKAEAGKISSKRAGADEKKQFALFLKRVMGEVVASFLAAFKVTTKMPMNKVPGVGEVNLAQIEQPTSLSAFNTVNTGSRVKYLVEKMTDSDLQDCINGAFAQGAVWCDDKGGEGSYVYECFARAETLDNESLIITYKFITGTRDSE